MKTEIFRISEVDDKKFALAKQTEKDRIKEEVSFLEKQATRFDLLGLDAQVKLIKDKIADVNLKIRRQSDLGPAMFYRPISKEDVDMWETWLPTSYKGTEALKNYRFDLMPEDALKELEMTKRLDLFDEYEIRTPERAEQDPIFIGWLGETPYLIARWGEILLPLDEIKNIVREGKRFVVKNDIKSCFMVVMFSISILAFFFSAIIECFPPKNKLPLATLISLSGIVIIALFSFMTMPNKGIITIQDWLDKRRDPASH